jgi:uncharacterized protein YndB with AHSA1/START domain
LTTNQYHFITRWRVQGTAEEVYALISRPEDFPRWWPSVYLEVCEIAAGNENGLGRRVRLHTKGWLPYKLLWESCSSEMARPHRLVLEASGDFNGRGIWTFEDVGELGGSSNGSADRAVEGWVNVTFDWELTADKPLLRYLSFLMKPVFAANHQWAMGRGEESLKLELARRHAPLSARGQIPAPPGPNRTSGWWLGLGAGVLIAAVALAVRMALR